MKIETVRTMDFKNGQNFVFFINGKVFLKYENAKAYLKKLRR